MRSLILGLGNPILGDDSVGLRVAREVARQRASDETLTIAEEERGGLALLEQMAGFDRVLVVDAIQTGAPVGTLHCLGVESVPTQRTATAHGINLRMALALGRQCGLSLPADDEIVILGIEAADVLTFSEQLTPEVEQAIHQAVAAIDAWLHEHRRT